MNQISSSLNDKNITWVLSLLVYTLSFSKYVYTSRQSRFKSLQSEEVTETAQDRTVSAHPLSTPQAKSFWSEPRITTCGWVQQQKSLIMDFPWNLTTMAGWEYETNILSMQRESGPARGCLSKERYWSQNIIICTKLSHSKATWHCHVSIALINQIHTCSRRGSFSSSSWVMPYSEGFLSILI